MATERIVAPQTQPADHAEANAAPGSASPALRPVQLDDYVGQPDIVRQLRITLAAARQRGDAMEHTLLHGPPGLGKTTLAHIIANEMGTQLTVTAGPALTKPGDLVGLLSKLQPRDVLFIDEIHRVPIAVEEYVYSAMEDFKIEVQIEQGMHARSVTLPLHPFTLIGATTRAGLISSPMRSRFGLAHHLAFYTNDDLLRILTRSAGLLNLLPDTDPAPAATPTPTPVHAALALIASRSRGTPRIANRLLRRVRDFAQVEHHHRIDPDIARQALELEGVDALGLDALDRAYLRAIAEVYQGGPVGLEAVAATLAEDAVTLEQAVEPFLLQRRLLARTRRGRQLTRLTYEHLHLTPPAHDADAADLFDASPDAD